jgi:hypothetical protein
MRKKRKKGKNRYVPGTLCALLAHPLRARILEVLNEEPLSPIGFIHKGLAPGFSTQQHALSQVSYHFNMLEKGGCITLVETVQRRGAVEHVFRGNGYAFAKKSETKLSSRRRANLLKGSLQGLLARIVGAVEQGTADGGEACHFDWQAVQLDKKGWTELRRSMESCSAEQKQILCEARKRLADQGAEKSTPGTVALLAFESPDYKTSPPKGAK